MTYCACSWKDFVTRNESLSHVHQLRLPSLPLHNCNNHYVMPGVGVCVNNSHVHPTLFVVDIGKEIGKKGGKKGGTVESELSMICVAFSHYEVKML